MLLRVVVLYNLFVLVFILLFWQLSLAVGRWQIAGGFGRGYGGRAGLAFNLLAPSIA